MLDVDCTSIHCATVKSRMTKKLSYICWILSEKFYESTIMENSFHSVSQILNCDETYAKQVIFHRQKEAFSGATVHVNFHLDIIIIIKDVLDSRQLN